MAYKDPKPYIPTDAVNIDDAKWHAAHKPVDISGKEELVVQLINELMEENPISTKHYYKCMRKYAKQGVPWFSKEKLLASYDHLCTIGMLEADPEKRILLQLKPIRSQSGVSVVTVLTKPYACPGKCIFCPTDVRMPKSYLHDEPGAQRAERHQFDPYDQTFGRIEALEKIGHPAEKIELIILGGTWSSYPRDYQEWFVKRCFDAMNGFEAQTLKEAQEFNVTGKRRNVGLVVETRQDHLTVEEMRWFRTLGVTKVQVGIQSMDENVLALNNRGHDTQSTRDAFKLLRLGGFKIHGHWMANLLGATPESDVADYASLWSDPAIRPDELKLYPCMLLENAELHDYYLRGEYTPYEEEVVIDILMQSKRITPRYCRLTRVIRDIPTTNVVEGFKKANLRQIAQQRMEKLGQKCNCIRCREIKRDKVSESDLSLIDTPYETDGTQEHFLSYETEDERIAGFLRLSLPDQDIEHPLPELADTAMIREVHVYGPALAIGETSQGDAQHIGIGTRLVEEAKRRARAAGYSKLAVISAIGTQKYYAKHGFVVDGLYMTAPLD